MNAPSEPETPTGNPGANFTTPNEGSDRLWAPWRMRYVAGGDREEGCLFCNRLAEKDDVRSLILYRGDSAFVIMNRYPYNTGHVMIVPNTHVSSPEDADSEVMSEMAGLRKPVLRAIRRTLSPEGFNLGLNIGTTAGAGIADHLHEHVVPRWHGDANFMPILASTMVMPELIPVTYAKLRAELDRELEVENRSATWCFPRMGSLYWSTTPVACREWRPVKASPSGAPHYAMHMNAERLIPRSWVGRECTSGMLNGPRFSCAPASVNTINWWVGTDSFLWKNWTRNQMPTSFALEASDLTRLISGRRGSTISRPSAAERRCNCGSLPRRLYNRGHGIDDPPVKRLTCYAWR